MLLRVALALGQPLGADENGHAVEMQPGAAEPSGELRAAPSVVDLGDVVREHYAGTKSSRWHARHPPLQGWTLEERSSKITRSTLRRVTEDAGGLRLYDLVAIGLLPDLAERLLAILGHSTGSIPALASGELAERIGLS